MEVDLPRTHPEAPRTLNAQCALNVLPSDQQKGLETEVLLNAVYRVDPCIQVGIPVHIDNRQTTGQFFSPSGGVPHLMRYMTSRLLSHCIAAFFTGIPLAVLFLLFY